MLSNHLTYLFVLGVSVAALPAHIAQQSASTLGWGPCQLEGFNYSLVTSPIQCTKLSVPLDYNSPNAGIIDLQLIKVNATREPFLGSVLFNPGGPGSSGVEDVAQKGHIYNATLGGHYDLIGFDPRGTGRTMPFVCRLNWTQEWSSRNLQKRDSLVHQNLTEVFDATGWNDSTYVANQCYRGQNRTAPYLSTAFVARDMIRIVDALGEDGMLRFWGGSYGTLLGQTVAAMFPERVNRMMLDSVVDASDYYQGAWLPTLEDTEKTLRGFFESCIRSGPDYCVLSRFNGSNTTAADLSLALNNGLQALLDQPNPIPAGLLANSARVPGQARTLYTAIKANIFSNLYRPYQYPLLALTIEPILRQNFTAFDPITSLPPPSADPFASVTNGTLPYHYATDSFWGIGCSESKYRASSPQDMHPLVAKQAAVSNFSDAFIGQLWPCAQWNPAMNAAERYSGFDTNITSPIKTKFPLMFVNGKFDPATPWSSARRATAYFEGSTLLTHGGMGHKFMRNPSRCTTEAVRAYFINGTLPRDGAFCGADVEAFEVLAEGWEGAGYVPGQ